MNVIERGKIGDACTVGDGAHASIRRTSEGVPYLMARNLKDGRISDEKLDFISEESFAKHFKTKTRTVSRIQTDDVIFGIIGSIGGAYRVRSGDRFGLSSSIAILRPDTKRLDSGYLFHWISSSAFQDSLYGIKGGVAQSYVSLEMIRQLPLYLPSLSTQRRIAAILSAYDDLIENNTRRIAILEEMARRLYEEWFIHFRFPGYDKAEFDGDLPKGWRTSTIGKDFSVVLGGTPSRAKSEFWTDGTVPWINSGRVNDLRILQPSEMITQEALSRSAAKVMPKGTVVLAITGATLGQVSVLMEEMAGNQSVVGVWDHTGVRNEYLYRMISHSIGSIISRASGGAQQHINKEIVKETPYIDPANDVLSRFNQASVPVGKKIEVLIRKNANLRAQRDMLLPKLISGEIDVSGAEEMLEAAE